MASEEVIRENMERTRESLTEKLDALENKVMGSVEEATTAVKDTVSSVKETMHDASESVKDAVDIPAQVERHPWLAFGGAILGGYLVTSMLMRDRPSASAPSKSFTLTPPRNPPDEPQPSPQPTSAPSARSGLLGALEPELRHLKGLALGVTLGTVREMVAKDVPPHLAEQLRAIMDSVTTKVGGEPIAPADLPFSDRPAGAKENVSSGV
jgi:hypothetical protein